MKRVDLLAADVRREPYPHYAEMRREGPVCQIDPGGLWAVSRHADVAYVLKEPGLFSSGGLRMLTEHPGLDHNPITSSLLVTDPPRHATLRALVNRAFGMSVIPRIEPIARAAAARSVDELREGRFVDFCETLATPLPASVITELLGLDPSQSVHMRRWGRDLFSINPVAPPEVIESARETVASLERHLLEVIASRQKSPRDDLVSDLLAAEIDGAALTQPELISFLALLLVAGFETTGHLLSSAMRLLVRNPDVHDVVRSRPALIPAFVSEVLRLEAPIQLTMRVATADTELGGVTIAAGSMVAALLGSANRDERVFEAPDRLDLGRSQQGALSFGHGIHTCIGAALARAEVRFALEALLALPGRFEEGPGEEDWSMGLQVRGLRTYPLRYVDARR